MTIALSLRLQRFYARQAHAVNSGDFDTYRDGFTPDAEFTVDGRPVALHGAEAVAEHSRRLAAERAPGGAVQRHHITMTAHTRRADGTLTARSATLIVTTPPHGRPAVTASTRCEDEFDDTGGRLRVRRRRVTPDAPPPAAPPGG
ncbi:nuclear transport factor 2 family protein [Streptomyces albireticuli]|uniref:nuclear transport factor 2 family protein n=1 Tax=Streptomyces albireticuli TaxID=1940 RepID=UPI003680F8B7